MSDKLSELAKPVFEADYWAVLPYIAIVVAFVICVLLLGFPRSTTSGMFLIFGFPAMVYAIAALTGTLIALHTVKDVGRYPKGHGVDASEWYQHFLDVMKSTEPVSAASLKWSGVVNLVRVGLSLVGVGIAATRLNVVSLLHPTHASGQLGATVFSYGIVVMLFVVSVWAFGVGWSGALRDQGVLVRRRMAARIALAQMAAPPSAQTPTGAGNTSDEGQPTRRLTTEFFINWFGLAESMTGLNKEITAELTSEVLTGIKGQERERAKWQASSRATWLGVALISIVASLIGLGVWEVLRGGGHIPPLLVYGWSGALGGSLMALYGFTHHYFSRSVTPLFFWWDISKPLFGCVTGGAAAELLRTGLLSAIAKPGPSGVWVLGLAAFVAGFKEQWFLGWLSNLKPHTGKAISGHAGKGRSVDAESQPNAKE